MLLIFDNCEHVVEDASALAALLLSECPRLQVLASSREPLAIAGEESYRLPALELPLPSVPLEPAAARKFGAVALFVDRAGAVDKRFALGPDNVGAVVEICRRLDGIALAIELAAAHVRSLSPAELERRLDERFRMLTDGRRDALPHQQTLRAAMDWSYDLLDDAERSLFRRLGIFAGGFTLDAAQAVAADLGFDEFDVLRRLTSLGDKSLVGAFVAGEATRYDLLETTRLYALEKLSRAGEREACAARHLAYYCSVFERADAALEMTLQDDAIIALSQELDNVRAALAWAVASGSLAQGASLAFASGRLWLEKGLVRECLDRIETLIEACGDDGDPGAIAYLWTSLAYLSGDSLRSARAFDAAAKALAAARRLGDPQTLHFRLLSYAVESARRLDVAAAAEALAEAEAIPGVEPTPRQRLRILNTRGLIAMQRNDIDAAAAAHAESLALARSVGAVYARLAGTLNLAELEHQRGNTRRAIELVKEVAPEVAVRLEFYTMVTLLNNLAGYLIAVDDVAGARDAAVESVGRLSRLDHGSGLMASALEHLALVKALEGSLEAAARISGYCETSYVASGYVREYTERVTHERLSALLERRFDPERLASLRAEGAAAAYEDVMNEAIS
jgi:predicted ATPase